MEIADPFCVCCARYVLGIVPARVMPAKAADALEAGHDTPSLRRLAGESPGDEEVICGLVQNAIRELDLPEPTRENEAFIAVRAIGEDVLAGRTGAYEGAREVWWKIADAKRETAWLLPFIGLASEYEDSPAHRDTYTKQILEQFRLFVDHTTPPPWPAVAR